MAWRIRAATLWRMRSGRGCRFYVCALGGRSEAFEQVGELRTLELGRSPASVRMEKDLEFDALFWRHGGAIRRELERFRPDVIHITGPSELGMFGAYFAWEMGIPLAASWHTNLHEYAARRMGVADCSSWVSAGLQWDKALRVGRYGLRRSSISWRRCCLLRTMSCAECWRRRRGGLAT